LFDKSINNDFRESFILDNSKNQDMKYIVITVRDNGTGIPQDKLSLIFNEKHSDQSNTNWDGTGLGLPICKHLCEVLNGGIIYDSEINIGSIFVF